MSQEMSRSSKVLGSRVRSIEFWTIFDDPSRKVKSFCSDQSWPISASDSSRRKRYEKLIFTKLSSNVIESRNQNGGDLRRCVIINKRAIFVEFFQFVLPDGGDPGKTKPSCSVVCNIKKQYPSFFLIKAPDSLLAGELEPGALYSESKKVVFPWLGWPGRPSHSALTYQQWYMGPGTEDDDQLRGHEVVRGFGFHNRAVWDPDPNDARFERSIGSNRKIKYVENVAFH